MQSNHLQEASDAMLAYHVGALADGSLYRNAKQYVHRVSYYQKSKSYLEHCIEPRIESLFGKKGHFYHDTRKDVFFYEVTIKSIYQAIHDSAIPFKDKTSPAIPAWIKAGSDEVRESFIRAFFDTEGFYYVNANRSDYRVRFGQASRQVLQDLRDMLSTTFTCSEVLGPYQSKANALPYFELHIYGIDQLRRFHDLIRPCHPIKQSIL